jgi:hypothetical protein
MAGVRFADVQARPAEFLNLTSLTLEEFEVLVAPFEAAFQDHMAAWRLYGKPRTARRFTVYRTCPLSTPEVRWTPLVRQLGWRVKRESRRIIAPCRCWGSVSARAAG